MAEPAIQALTEPAAGLGLRTGRVTVVEHDQRWAKAFASVAEVITTVLGDPLAGVEHIGSTSVPGLAAKPMIDIAVGLPGPIDAERIIRLLSGVGFHYETDLGMYGGLFFTVAAAPEVIVAHLHVVDIDDFQWRWYLAFRDGLRNDPELRNEYQALKLASASRHADDRDGYTQAKFDWVLDTVNRLDQSGSDSD